MRMTSRRVGGLARWQFLAVGREAMVRGVVSRSAVLLRVRGQGAPFPVPARRTVRAVLPHTAHRGRSPPVFGFLRQARKGLGA